MVGNNKGLSTTTVSRIKILISYVYLMALQAVYWWEQSSAVECARVDKVDWLDKVVTGCLWRVNVGWVVGWRPGFWNWRHFQAIAAWAVLGRRLSLDGEKML